MAQSSSAQVVGNIGMYYAAYRLWNVTPTAGGNARAQTCSVCRKTLQKVRARRSGAFQPGCAMRVLIKQDVCSAPKIENPPLRAKPGLMRRSQRNDLADAASGLLLVSVLVMAVVTSSAMFSAILATIRYDIIPTVWSNLAPERRSRPIRLSRGGAP
jgi:hypothetical protein